VTRSFAPGLTGRIYGSRDDVDPRRLCVDVGAVPTVQQAIRTYRRRCSRAHDGRATRLARPMSGAVQIVLEEAVMTNPQQVVGWRPETWQTLMAAGVLGWLALEFLERGARASDNTLSATTVIFAVMQLVTGLLILQGACEALVQSVEHLGGRLAWDAFVAGTIAEMLATLPEFVVVVFLVQVDPTTAFTVAFITVYNNALIMSVYAFFLPRNREGLFAMPRAITRAGTEVLIAGAGLVLIVGIIKLVGATHLQQDVLAARDLIIIAVVLFSVFGLYLHTLVRHHAAAPDHDHGHEPAAHAGWGPIAALFVVGVVGAIIGGDAVSAFADDALNNFKLPSIPTAILLAFFAGVSELLIIYKAHRRRQLAIALSNAFGGVAEVMFLVVPFTMLTIGLFAVFTGNPMYAIPVNFTTTTLVLLIFPVFFVLLQYLRNEHTFSVLQAGAMTGLYVLLLYALMAWEP
jgi:Ca2+/Na+ antiporter